jgi:PhnB protein
MHLSPYLLFNGNCEEALKFYEQTLGANIKAVMKNEGSPMAEHTPPEWLDKVLHATFTVDDQTLMASDAPPGHYSQPQGISIAIGMNDAAKGEVIFNKLAEGGTVQLPYQATFWAKGFGMCVDRFGIPWMVNCEQQGGGN